MKKPRVLKSWIYGTNIADVEQEMSNRIGLVMPKVKSGEVMFEESGGPVFEIEITVKVKKWKPSS